MQAFLHTCSVNNGRRECFLTREVPVKHSPLEWQKRGLQFTASGYGSRIPTEYMIKVDGRWRRVYCCICSNIGTLFIGKSHDNTATVQIEGQP